MEEPTTLMEEDGEDDKMDEGEAKAPRRTSAFAKSWMAISQDLIVVPRRGRLIGGR
jgi:hypothetical protein